MQAIPQPSGWPAFGFGCGHPKSRKFRPVSASWRNARSVSTGAGLRLTIPSMRHMSAQLVPDLPEERDPILPFLRSLHALRPLAIHDAEDAPSARGLGHHDVHGIRGRREDRHDLGHVPQGRQHVDREGIPQEHDEEMPRSDGEGVLRREGFQVLRVAFDPDQAGPRRLAERDAEMDAWNGTDEGFVDVLRGLDEVGLAEDHIQGARVLDRDELRVHRHRRCIRPRELKSCCDSPGYATCMRKGEVLRFQSGRMARLKGLWTILGEVEEPGEREDLALVATTIQVHFVNVKARERAIVEFMAVRFRWPGSRTRRRLATLVDLGVLRCARDLADNWTKGFEGVDPPHVPSALAPGIRARRSSPVSPGP